MFEMPNSHLIIIHTGSFKQFNRMEKDKFAVVVVLVFSLFACQSLMFLIQKKNNKFVLSLHVCPLYMHVKEILILWHSLFLIINIPKMNL